ncbi:conserved hypothetical protein [Vibrio owensii]|nr:conserved hypothetical protein [Vibrio owensii]CAH1550858.1 conserved hypothetical protein [Vibrio owensii]
MGFRLWLRGQKWLTAMSHQYAINGIIHNHLLVTDFARVDDSRSNNQY